MECKIKYTSTFEREFKYLAKRYRSLKDDVASLKESLSSKPMQGVDLGNGLRKIRMAITSKGKGKSGGARVITFVVFVTDVCADITLLTIYDKSDRENISDKEIVRILHDNGL